MPDLKIIWISLELEKPKDPAIEQLQKQINDIVQELNLLKEQQALQTGELHLQRPHVVSN